MSRIFDVDNPVMQFLEKLCNLVIINVLTMALCIPVITFGPAMTACHYMCLKIVRGEDTYIVKGYFHSFKENLKQGIGTGLIILLIYFVMGADAYLMLKSRYMEIFPTPVRILIFAVCFILLIFTQWVFPVLCHFVNTVSGTFRNAFLLGIGHLFRSIVMTLVWIIPVLLLSFTYALIPLFMMFGISLPVVLQAMLYSPVFEKLEPEKPKEVSDADFELSDDPADLEALKEAIETAVPRNKESDNDTELTTSENAAAESDSAK